MRRLITKGPEQTERQNAKSSCVLKYGISKNKIHCEDGCIKKILSNIFMISYYFYQKLHVNVTVCLHCIH